MIKLHVQLARKDSTWNSLEKIILLLMQKVSSHLHVNYNTLHSEVPFQIAYVVVQLYPWFKILFRFNLPGVCKCMKQRKITLEHMIKLNRQAKRTCMYLQLQ